jgi:hypothetical protein
VELARCVLKQKIFQTKVIEKNDLCIEAKNIPNKSHREK